MTSCFGSQSNNGDSHNTQKDAQQSIQLESDKQVQATEIEVKNDTSSENGKISVSRDEFSGAIKEENILSGAIDVESNPPTELQNDSLQEELNKNIN